MSLSILLESAASLVLNLPASDHADHASGLRYGPFEGMCPYQVWTPWAWAGVQPR